MRCIFNFHGKSIHSYGLILVLAAGVLGCDNPSSMPESPSASSEESASLIPDSLISALPLANAVGVVEARKDVQPRTKVTVSGFVGGRSKPFVESRAIFTLADADALTRCDETPDDMCTTPWDACCDDSEAIKSAVATVQVVDDNGAVLQQSLENFGGIEAGSNVTVQGTIAPGSTEAALIINADSIHVSL